MSDLQAARERVAWAQAELRRCENELQLVLNALAAEELAKYGLQPGDVMQGVLWSNLNLRLYHKPQLWRIGEKGRLGWRGQIQIQVFTLRKDGQVALNRKPDSVSIEHIVASWSRVNMGEANDE